MKLSVITVTYNCENFVENFLKKLLVNLPKESEVILVDNNSTDKTVKIVKEFREVKLISSQKNLGFGKGSNLGTDKSKGEFLFFLNPDASIDENIFDELIEYYEEGSEIGLIGPKLSYVDGMVQESVRKFPTLLGAIKEYVFGIKNAYSQYIPKTQEPMEVEVVYAAAILIKKDLFEQIGGFDERFFMYYEDIDLCRRLKKTGKKIIYYPKVKVTHLLGASKSVIDRNKLNHESAKIYHGFFIAFLLELIFFVPRIKRKIGIL